MSKGFLGRKHTEESKKKTSESLKGRPGIWLGKKRPEIAGANNPASRPDIRKKISIARKGQNNSPNTQFKKGQIGFWKGKKRKPHTEEWKIKHSEDIRGSKNGNWRDGISEKDYPFEFNARLKLKVRTRDNFICVLCGRTEREELEELNRVLCVNHIDFDKNNCKEENLNTLCLRCNVKINRKREYWTDYFNNIL